MSGQFSFLELPVEVRCLIYRRYVTLQGGCYYYNPISNKLTASGNEPIDLALMYSCKLIAQEMNGVALGTNTISFSCISSRDLETKRGTAIMWEEIMTRLWKTEYIMFHYVRPCIDESMYDDLARTFPKLIPMLDEVLGQPDTSQPGRLMSRWTDQALAEDRYTLLLTWRQSMGEAFTTSRHFITKTLQLASTHKGFAERMRQMQRDEAELGYSSGSDEQPDVLTILSLCHDPGHIPTTDCITRLANLFGISKWATEGFMEPLWTPHTMWKFRWSAAAAAIRFLHSIPRSTRLQLRNILLNEDRQAVCYPECHAQGLIQFCQENLRLRIRRRVNLWWNVFQKHAQDQYAMRNYRTPKLESNYLTPTVAPWIMEALALGPPGMPEESFTLVLDGEPAPKQCSDIFEQVIQRDIACQVAWERTFQHFHNYLWIERSSLERKVEEPCFQFRHLPQAMQDIVRNDSIVHCNFDPGCVWDVERLLTQHPRSWGPEQWETFSSKHRPKERETFLPLPPWHELILDSCHRGELGRWEEIQLRVPPH